MTDDNVLSGPTLGPQAGGRPGRLVALLHGVGADGADLIGLAPHWAALLPDALFVAPDAPQRCDMAPFGRQWFSLQDRSHEAMLAGVRACAPILDRFLDGLLESHGLGAERLALAGFSQGAMMSLYVAPRRPAAPAAVVSYSGALLGPDELAATPARPPVLLAHGDADDVVPVAAAPRAAKTLRAAGFAVEYLIRPGLGHSIDIEGLRAGGAFLQRAFSAAQG